MGLANQPTLSIESIAQQDQDASMEQSSAIEAGNDGGEGSEPPESDQPIILKVNEKIGNLGIRL